VSERDAAEFIEASYTPDVAVGCDSLGDHITELVTEACPKITDAKQVKKLGRVVKTVVSRLLDEGRLGPLVDVQKLQGRELLAALIDEIIIAPEPRLMARCIDFVMELGVQCGISETKIAQLEGVTRASASRYCVHLKKTYRKGLPAAGMKPNKAVESYRNGRTGKSSRPPRAEWPFAKTFAQHYERTVLS